jgi:hypothetical protein
VSSSGQAAIVRWMLARREVNGVGIG